MYKSLNIDNFSQISLSAMHYRRNSIIINNNNNKKRKEKENEPPKRLQAYLEGRVLKGCNAGELFKQSQWQLFNANVDCCDEQHLKKPFIEAVSNCVASERNWRFWPITSKEADCKARTNNAAKKKCVPANQEYFCVCLRMMRYIVSQSPIVNTKPKLTRNYIRSFTTHSICRLDSSNILWKITATETITNESNQIRNFEKNQQMNCSFRLFEIIQKFTL